MKPDFWTRFLDGPLAVTDDRLGDYLLRVADGSLDAKTLYRNLGRLLTLFEDRAPLEKMLSTAAGGEHLPPYLFYMAAQRWPDLRGPIHDGMNKAAKAGYHLQGETVVVLDSSAKMLKALAPSTRLTKLEAAACFAAQIRGDSVRYFTASNELLEVDPKIFSPDGPGLGGADFLMIFQEPRGDFLSKALPILIADIKFDRMIILTDDSTKVFSPDYIFDKFGAAEMRWLHKSASEMEALENKTGTLH